MPDPGSTTQTKVLYNESEDLRKGEELMLFYDDKPIAYCTSMKPNLSVGKDDVSSKMSGEWDSSLPGKIGWSYDVESMVSVGKGHISYDKLLSLAVQRKPIRIKECTTKMEIDPTSGKKTFSVISCVRQGECIIENISLTSSAGERDTFSCTLTGVTPLYGEKWGEVVKDPDL